tara:strand:+ start:5566 stop:6114 length:549 start_codon:yes stop_codon:yes gene_type:complete
MAAKHILSLEVPTVANCEILKIIDTSQYADNLPIDCPELLITPPGFNIPAQISVQPGFDLNINACALNLQTTGCNSTRANLQDGIYIIKYSVAPNDKVYVEYNLLRTTTILSEYYRKLCELDITPCEPTSTRRQLLAEMKYIRTLIDAAKAKVEYCQSPHEGMELYEFAKKKLAKITCDVCC